MPRRGMTSQLWWLSIVENSPGVEDECSKPKCSKPMKRAFNTVITRKCNDQEKNMLARKQSEGPEPEPGSPPVTNKAGISASGTDVSASPRSTRPMRDVAKRASSAYHSPAPMGLKDPAESGSELERLEFLHNQERLLCLG